MAVRLETDWDTSSNREAEGSFIHGRRHDADAFQRSEKPAFDDYGETDETAEHEQGEEDFPVTLDQLMRLTRSAYNQGMNYQQTVLQPRWQSAYNAFNNKHASGSKYASTRFRGRSSIFRPKTRSTARKKQSEAASALFSTSDTILVQAADETDERQKAGAELLNELLRYRLDRASENNNIQWFQIAMGAHQVAVQTSICCSKQYWEYRRIEDGEEEYLEPFMWTDPMSGQEIHLGDIPKTRTKWKVIRDRPRVMLLPPEDVIRDPAGAWEDQSQDSGYIILRFPMTVEAAKTFIGSSNDKSMMKFHEVTDTMLTAAAGGAKDDTGAGAVRRARESSGNDRYSDQSVDAAYQTVWLHENFFRIDGRDYVFWTIGVDQPISDVIPVEEAYPEFNGARPIVIGTGALEPFKIDPMAPVESWQPLQQEMNDIANLRLDVMKQTIAPLAKVVRGRSVDIKALQNRTTDTVVYVSSKDDIEFDRPAGASSEAYLEMEKLNADFDDQAGNFSIQSVQTNRQLGETVGGMQLMSSNANAIGEFDLRVWVETWVEPVLRQLVKLEQYYENDETVMAISAKRAGLQDQQQGMGQQIDEEMLSSQVTVYVDIGLGSSDPMQSLQKFDAASKIALGMLGPQAQMNLNHKAVIDQVFGKAGFKNASDRFFLPEIEEDPRLMQMQQQMQQLEGVLQQMQQELADRSLEMQTRKDVAKLNVLGGLAKQEMSQEAAQEQAFQQTAFQEVGKAGERKFQMQQGERERSFQQQQGATSHQRSMEMQSAKAQQTRAVQQDKMAASATPKMAAQQKAGAGAESQTLASLLGLKDQDPAAAVAPLAQAMMQGMQMIARQIAEGQQQTAQIIAQGNDRMVQAITAPKRLVRGPDGLAGGVETDFRG